MELKLHAAHSSLTPRRITGHRRDEFTARFEAMFGGKLCVERGFGFAINGSSCGRSGRSIDRQTDRQTLKQTGI